MGTAAEADGVEEIASKEASKTMERVSGSVAKHRVFGVRRCVGCQKAGGGGYGKS
ncbi:MAG: hypothetical protein QXF51_02410 [Nitrososphaerota archaeon]